MDSQLVERRKIRKRYLHTSSQPRNPPDVAANESPIFGDDQQMWKGNQVLREHVQSDAHANSELRKWWFTRSRKSIDHHTIACLGERLTFYSVSRSVRI